MGDRARLAQAGVGGLALSVEVLLDLFDELNEAENGGMGGRRCLRRLVADHADLRPQAAEHAVEVSATLAHDLAGDAQLPNDIELAPDEVGQLAPGRSGRRLGIQGGQASGQPLDLRRTGVAIQRGNLRVVHVDFVVQTPDDGGHARGSRQRRAGQGR